MWTVAFVIYQDSCQTEIVGLRLTTGVLAFLGFLFMGWLMFSQVSSSIEFERNQGMKDGSFIRYNTCNQKWELDFLSTC